MRLIYLDNAATTPLSIEVKDAMIEAMDLYGNPSSSHSLGRKTKAFIESNRREVAQHFNCTPGEIIFTSGGTEADNLAILGACEAQAVSHIITSKLEHSAVLKSAEKAQKLFGIPTHFVNVDQKGVVDLNHLEQLLQAYPNALVSLMLVNNELGNLLWCCK